MGAADNTHTRLSQLHGILPLQVVGHGIAQPGEILVPVAPDQFFREQGTVQYQPFFRNFHSPHAHPHGAVVQQMGRILGIRPSGGLPDLYAQRVQIGIIRRPRPDIGNHQRNIHFTRGMRRNHEGGRLPHGVHALGVRHQRLHAHFLLLVRIVGYLHLHPHLSLPGTRIKGFRPEKDAAAGHGSRFIRVRNINGARRNQVRITVNAAEIGKIQTLLGLSGRIGAVVGIVRLHDDDVLLARLQPLVQIHDDGEIPAEMFGGLLAVHPYLALPHDPFKIQGISLAFQIGRRRKRLPVPDRSLVIGAAAGLFRQQFGSVGEIHGLPGRIVKIRSGHALRSILPLEKLPAYVHTVHMPFGRLFRQAKRSGYGILACGGSRLLGGGFLVRRRRHGGQNRGRPKNRRDVHK